MPIDIDRLAARQLADYDAARPGLAFADGLQLGEAEAYQVQAAVAELRSRRGERLVGYKVGCTSPAIQQQLQIDHPVYGRLFASECYRSAAPLPADRFDRLAVEGEWAVRLGLDAPSPSASDDEALQAIGTIFPVIELHNYVFRGDSPSAAELVANNALHAGLVMPAREFPVTRTNDLPNLAMRIHINGQLADSYDGHGELQHIAESLRWLAEAISAHGQRLQHGQLVLTGSRMRLIPVGAGSEIVVTTAVAEVVARIVGPEAPTG